MCEQNGNTSESIHERYVTDEEVTSILQCIRDDEQCKRGGIRVVRELPKEAHTKMYRVIEFDLDTTEYDAGLLHQSIMKHVHIPHSHVQGKGLWSASILRLMIPKYVKQHGGSDCIFYVSISKIVQVFVLLGGIYLLQCYK